MEDVNSAISLYSLRVSLPDSGGGGAERRKHSELLSKIPMYVPLQHD